jgi:hypothetical protein
MSALLEAAAKLDSERAAALAANDVAMEMEPRVMRVFRIQLREGVSVRSEFDAMGLDSMTVTMQHMDLVAEGGSIVVRAVEAA